MGLAVRIIPTILTRGRTMVKGVAFDSWRSVGLAHQAVRIHSMRGVDELVMLDIGATPEGRGPDLKLVEELAECCFMPLGCGGGINTVEDVDRLLRAGADKTIIRSAATPYDDFKIVRDCAARFGSQAIVVDIDYRGKEVFTACDVGHPFDALTWAKGAVLAGAGEIILTAMEREGTFLGYDIETIAKIARAVDVPVIANGGCGTPEHAFEAIQAGASAVAIGAMLLFTDHTPKSTAEYLSKKGVEVRL